MLTMAAYVEVKECLKQLMDAVFRMVTLTTSTPSKEGKSPLENAGLAAYFERQFSVKAARAYKPAQVHTFQGRSFASCPDWGTLSRLPWSMTSPMPSPPPHRGRPAPR